MGLDQEARRRNTADRGGRSTRAPCTLARPAPPAPLRALPRVPGPTSRDRTEVEGQPQDVVPVPTPCDQQRVVGVLDLEAAEPQGGVLPAQREQPACEPEGRRRILLLQVHRAHPVRGIERQPGGAVRKSCVRRRCLPRHRRAAAVAALAQRPVGLAERVLQVLERDLALRQAEFLALVEEDRAAQGGEQGEVKLWRGPGPGWSVTVASVPAPPKANEPPPAPQREATRGTS